MTIFYHISPYPALSEGMVARIYEANAPTAEVDHVDIPAPHNAPVSVTFSGRDRVPHIVRLYAATSNTLLHSYDVLPTASTMNVFDPISFKIGDGGANTPGVGEVMYSNNTAFVGLGVNDFIVHRNGYGFLIPSVHYTYNAGSGFSLFPGDSFTATDEFLIQIKPKMVTTPVNDSVVGKTFGGFLSVGANMSYDPSHLRKLIKLQLSYEYTFAAGVPVPIGYIFCFTNFDTGGLPKVLFLNNPLNFGGVANKTILNIPAKSSLSVVYDGSLWHIVNANDAIIAAN